MNLLVGFLTLILVIAGGCLLAIPGKYRQVGVIFLLSAGMLLVIPLAQHYDEQQQEKRAEIAASKSESRVEKSEEAAAVDGFEEETEPADWSTSVSESSDITVEAASETVSEVSAQASEETASSVATPVADRATTSYQDTRPAEASSRDNNYAYQPVPQTGAQELVYVNTAIPGRYHRDPNCRGLQRYGGGTAMTFQAAQQQGYQAYCTYERYGDN